MERFTGLLIEHFEGKFPTWLAPEQIRVLPISQQFNDEAQKIVERLAAIGARVKLDGSGDKVGAKIRLARLDRVPYMLVLGAREVENGQVSVRHRDRDDLGTQSVDDFVTTIEKEISERSL